MKNLVGKILNHYEIESELSRKAGRKTFKARDTRTGEFVVIKLLFFSDDFEWDDLKLFEREVQTLKNLNHTAIPRYIDSFDSQAPAFFALVQSYVPIPTLEHHLKTGGTFTETQVKEIARHILEILVYLQAQNPPVIHRDIKPSNILIDLQSDKTINQVYLIDFGSVKTLTLLDEDTVVGTYGYMAPEQFGGRAVPASDLYSLGATLIHCCTGIHPADLPQRDLQIQFQELTNLSSEFTNWLKWMTQPSLDQRLPNVRKSIEILEAPASTQQLTTTKKPTGSKIQLTKSVDALEVLIPPSGIDTSIIFLTLFAVAWNAGIFAWTVGATSIPFPTNIVLSLFSLPFWGAGLFMVYWVLFSLFGKTRLLINQNQISLIYELFGFKFYRTCASQLTMGIIKSEIELEWLAREVNDWFGI